MEGSRSIMTLIKVECVCLPVEIEDERVCPARDFNRYCRRPVGHDGPHVTCSMHSGRHRLWKWVDQFQEVNEPKQ